MASEEHNTTVKRRAYRKKGWKYLLDDNNHTAWIAKGHIGRCRRFRVPDHVMIEGVRYTPQTDGDSFPLNHKKSGEQRFLFQS